MKKIGGWGTSYADLGTVRSSLCGSNTKIAKGQKSQIERGILYFPCGFYLLRKLQKF